jgi:Protein of unknown function (DUF2442)
MSTLIDTPASARYADGNIIVAMSSGFEFSFPCSDYPRLEAASPDERSRVELSPFGIHWPDIDEDLSIAGLLRDHASNSQGQAFYSL